MRGAPASRLGVSASRTGAVAAAAGVMEGQEAAEDLSETERQRERRVADIISCRE